MRVRRLSDTSVAVLEATALSLVLEAGVGINSWRGGGGSVGGGGGGVLGAQPSPHAYLKGLAPGRKALLLRAAGYCSRGAHARKGDLFSVSFEGVPHVFRVAKLEPRVPIPVPCGRQHAATATTATAPAVDRTKGTTGDGGDSLVTPLGKLSISEASAASVPERSKAFGSSAAVAAPAPAAGKDGEGKDTRAAGATDGVDDSSGAEKPAHNRASGQEAATPAARVRLEAFYREHNPEKLNGGDIDGILAKYAGREETLFAKLEKKYGAGSSVLRTAADGGNTGTERHQQQQRRHPAPPLAATPDRAAAPAARSPFPGQQPLSARGLDRKTAGDPHHPAPSPSAKRQDPEALSRSGVLGGDDTAGIRSWGANEALWIVGPDTSIQVSAADAPPGVDDNWVFSAAPLDPSGATPGGFGGDTPQTRGAPGGGTEGSPRHKPDGGEEGDGDWGSVGGLSSQIQQLREAIELPLRSPEVLRRYGVRPPRGVLLHGPPGTGKTTLARAAARACGCHVIVVNGSELMSRLVNGCF